MGHRRAVQQQTSKQSDNTYSLVCLGHAWGVLKVCGGVTYVRAGWDTLPRCTRQPEAHADLITHPGTLVSYPQVRRQPGVASHCQTAAE